MGMLFDKHFALFTTSASNESYLRAERRIHCHRCAIVNGLVVGMRVHQ
jgi:hypothetical protein